MPEYLAPGVYVEETTFRQKSIEGVSTSTAGFVGPTRFGPTGGEPELLTSFLDFERIYGGIDQLVYDGVTQHNDLAHAVRGFFENGGRRLYVARTFEHSTEPSTTTRRRWTSSSPTSDCSSSTGRPATPTSCCGRGSRVPPATSSSRVEAKVGPNILVAATALTPARLSGALRWDTVLARAGDPDSTPEASALYVVDRSSTTSSSRSVHVLRSPAGDTSVPDIAATEVDEIRVITLTVTVSPLGRFMDEQVWEGLNPDPRHRRQRAGPDVRARAA